MKTILGIETSCDECSAAIVRDPGNGVDLEVLSVVTHSQIPLHQPYGGVVPEIASRNHLETVQDVIQRALSEAGVHPKPRSRRADDIDRGRESHLSLDGVAVTNRPGLIGALLVGVSTAKVFSYVLDLPLVPVHHLEAHICSIFLDSNFDSNRGSQPPARSLATLLPALVAVVSGGHSNLYVLNTLPEDWPTDVLFKSCVGQSRDDAAGEAFDKVAKLLGFPYPGGIWIEKSAINGNPDAYALPRALSQKDTFDFSFSGLKTAASLTIKRLKEENRLEGETPNLCASLQEAIVSALVSKIELASQVHRCGSIVLVGGVAANLRLRESLSKIESWQGAHLPIFYPKIRYCTDNAAMVAAAGAFRLRNGNGVLGREQALKLTVYANPIS